ncbi:hypothetical protein PPERSA_11573 [Pseudocohnilembus persalinus]|uniref:Uncharacterized protein n=1 Tax=Pseudocohnilembus persalinus TaxID=266149 RepID=A0A0V0Q9R4_PSEPJ|nr:hypothetical protein PPERSA_11573 [Pseudocohnilembus persalinus]|eukprot:KRW98972.1 hypothetical protein PPERSA_11573 [Pseudocohnilembus persalinus]
MIEKSDILKQKQIQIQQNQLYVRMMSASPKNQMNQNKNFTNIIIQRRKKNEPLKNNNYQPIQAQQQKQLQMKNKKNLNSKQNINNFYGELQERQENQDDSFKACNNDFFTKSDLLGQKRKSILQRQHSFKSQKINQIKSQNQSLFKSADNLAKSLQENSKNIQTEYYSDDFQDIEFAQDFIKEDNEQRNSLEKKSQQSQNIKQNNWNNEESPYYTRQNSPYIENYDNQTYDFENPSRQILSKYNQKGKNYVQLQKQQYDSRRSNSEIQIQLKQKIDKQQTNQLKSNNYVHNNNFYNDYEEPCKPQNNLDIIQDNLCYSQKSQNSQNIDNYQQRDPWQQQSLNDFDQQEI